MTVIDLQYRRATKEVDNAIADIRAQTLSAIRFLEREAAARRARLEQYLQEIEQSVEWRRPSDGEPS